MTARSERKAAQVRSNILDNARPEGCVGDLGITTGLQKLERGHKYACTPYIGCAGLEGALVEAPMTESRSCKAPSVRLQRRIENLALIGAKAGFTAICATCPLGLQGQRHREAREIMATESGVDSIDAKLELAAASKATAEAEARKAEAGLELARLAANSPALAQEGSTPYLPAAAPDAPIANTNILSQDAQQT
jgi:hypothetical protein